MRTHKVLNGGGTLRVDSLVYDAAHRIIRRIDAEGRVTQIVRDALGRDSVVITPNAETTRYWYTSYGQLDSVRGPATTGASRFSHESTWRNTSAEYAPGVTGTPSAQHYYDGFGRRTETRSKITVAVTSVSSELQWRRRMPFYNAANQVDSTYTQRTDNCAAPCNSPAWPLATDTLRSVITRTTFNRLGLDSVRTIGDTTWTREVFRYDALGRLVQHWPRRRPPVDTASVSYRYDVAGNLRFTVTRRGHTLESQYDTRSRVSRRVLGATVGTFDYAYGGPNDELTAVTAQPGYADPVGGSAIGAAWVYNQSGQLVSETTQGNRTTAFGYSAALLRLTSYTDAIGTWNIRYDAATGLADSLSDPNDGWIRYVFSQGRTKGPYITGAGQPFQRTQQWRPNSGLQLVTNGHGYNVGEWLAAENEVDDTLTSRWIERRGSGAPAIELEDSVTYDGWGRVIALKQLINGQHYPINDEAFSFDSRGNLTIGSSGALFNPMNRLVSTNDCGYSYDVAGNLVGKTCNSVTWTYTYDALDRLTNVTNSSGLNAAYTYDALGNRIAKKMNGTVTRFVWRNGHVIYETDAGGTITLSYTWGMATDDLIAIHRYSDQVHRYVVQDKLRSVRGLVDRGGTWLASWRFRAYGTQLDSAGGVPGSLRRFRWAGAQYDEETGFYFLRSRYYDPTIGRFTQEDKVGRAGGSNLYSYVGGNPLEARDPGGTRQSEDAQYFFYHFEVLPVNNWIDDARYLSASAWPNDFYLESVVRGYMSAYIMMLGLEEYRQRQAVRAARASQACPECLEIVETKTSTGGSSSSPNFVLVTTTYAPLTEAQADRLTDELVRAMRYQDLGEGAAVALALAKVNVWLATAAGLGVGAAAIANWSGMDYHPHVGDRITTWAGAAPYSSLSIRGFSVARQDGSSQSFNYPLWW